MTTRRRSLLISALWTTLLLSRIDNAHAFVKLLSGSAGDLSWFLTANPSTSTLPPCTSAKTTTITLSAVSIRVAQIPQDLPALRECRAVAFADKKNLLDSEKSFINAEQVVKNPSVTCIVASEGNKIVGTADVRLGKKEAYVNNVFVLPDQRGKGVGRRLMTEGIEDLVIQPAPSAPSKVTLTVKTKNTPAITLYEKIGYTPWGVANQVVKGLSDTLGADLMLGMHKDV